MQCFIKHREKKKYLWKSEWKINGKTCDCFSEPTSGNAALFSRGHGHSGAGFEDEPPPFRHDASNQKGCAHRRVPFPGEGCTWPGPLHRRVTVTQHGSGNGAVYPRTAFMGQAAARGHAFGMDFGLKFLCVQL